MRPNLFCILLSKQIFCLFYLVCFKKEKSYQLSHFSIDMYYPRVGLFFIALSNCSGSSVTFVYQSCTTWVLFYKLSRYREMLDGSFVFYWDTKCIFLHWFCFTLPAHYIFSVRLFSSSLWAPLLFMPTFCTHHPFCIYSREGGEKGGKQILEQQFIKTNSR